MTASEANVVGRLTSGRLLAINTLWNLLASVATVGIALFSVPILIRYLGTDRFGVITLVWVVEGQFSLFDLGLSQALTKLVAEKLGSLKDKEIPALFWSSLLIMGVFGLLGSVVLRIVAPWLVHSVLKVPANIEQETLTSFYLVAISLPIVISSAGLRGFLAAHQRFDLLSAIRVPISLFSYLAPLLVLPFSHQLGPVILVLVVSRFLAWIIHFVLCLWVSPDIRHTITIKDAPFSRMFRFGGWMTVTNIVGPIMVNLDRFMIGALISMSAVAYYATPYEAVTKLWIIPAALSGVLFPALSTALVQDKRRAAVLFESSVKYTFLVLFPLVLGVLALGHFGLQIWLGPVFADKCTTVLRLLVLGVFVNSLAQMAFWQIQAAGRPDLAAKAHFLELPAYLLMFWLLTTHYGITGAAIAWVVRICADAAVMFWLAGRLLVESKPFVRRLPWLIATLIPLYAIAALISTKLVAVLFLVAALTSFALVTWFRVLTEKERRMVLNPLQIFSGLQFRTR